MKRIYLDNGSTSFPKAPGLGKRIMEYIYIGHESDKKEISDIAERLFGEYGGYAQQYLFYYGKEMKLGKPEKTAKTKELKKV